MEIRVHVCRNVYDRFGIAVCKALSTRRSSHLLVAHFARLGSGRPGDDSGYQ